jgi:hypothetical protein
MDLGVVFDRKMRFSAHKPLIFGRFRAPTILFPRKGADFRNFPEFEGCFFGVFYFVFILKSAKIKRKKKKKSKKSKNQFQSGRKCKKNQKNSKKKKQKKRTSAVVFLPNFRRFRPNFPPKTAEIPSNPRKFRRFRPKKHARGSFLRHFQPFLRHFRLFFADFRPFWGHFRPFLTDFGAKMAKFGRFGPENRQIRRIWPEFEAFSTELRRELENQPPLCEI